MQVTYFQKLISFFIPIKIKSLNSPINGPLYINLYKNKFILDTKNINYSYGKLQEILHIGLNVIGKKNIKTCNNILVLGLGTGSVVETLVKDFDFKKDIIGIEKDPLIIDLTHQYYEIQHFSNLTIHQKDTFEFVLETKIKYDLIIIDIFLDNQMPQFLFESFFQSRLLEILNTNKYILFNTFIFDQKNKERNKQYQNYFENKRCEVNVINFPKDNNEMLIITKKSII